jgi:RNA polymerase sigma-70 factor (ECF subfamily)
VRAETDEAVATAAPAESFDYEAVFNGHFRRIARVILRVIQDPSRAEELAVDVFWKLWRSPSAQGPQCAGWLYRTGVRAAVDELRKRSRREKYERWFGVTARSEDPEAARAATEQRTRVRTVLAALRLRDAQLIALRSEGLSYEELAEALQLKPASVGTILRRAHESFRQEYVRRYGED